MATERTCLKEDPVRLEPCDGGLSSVKEEVKSEDEADWSTAPAMTVTGPSIKVKQEMTFEDGVLIGQLEGTFSLAEHGRSSDLCKQEGGTVVARDTEPAVNDHEMTAQSSRSFQPAHLEMLRPSVEEKGTETKQSVNLKGSASVIPNKISARWRRLHHYHPFILM
ncbi:uncharacterized protein LOC134540489 isoform X4 [Bacillus rossius redtenbacheri]|uniref:uncharacterized protein LOC134540489 isoform X4 n=1 Tax=Bacillus rossius redtenbacheri TaxID=93214 RepID=UPI002FDD5D64